MTYDPMQHADVVYSPDDESATGKGWYVSRHDGASTILCKTRQEAERRAKAFWPGVTLHMTDASYDA